MNYIKITHDNLEYEHICCAISNNKDIQVSSKKAWLSERMKEGLVFLKSVERGKCFIEYIPAENAWCPIDANGYMHINCFWVSGSLKGHGYANDLLNACIADAKAQGKRGITVISSQKKMPFLSDPKYLAYKGFKVADTANPFYTLMYLPFVDKEIVPKFKECAKYPHIGKQGFVIYYTYGCPFTAKYVPIIKDYAKEKGVPGLLYAISYTVKMSKRGNHKIEGFFDYVVPPLEGLWWLKDSNQFDFSRKDDFCWVSMIRLPDFVTKEEFDWAIREATDKKKTDFSSVEYLTVQEGLCVQCMHIGSYDDEPVTISAMHAYAKEQGYEIDLNEKRRHHEIYLGDPRKTRPENLKTVIRIPVTKQ